MPVLPRDEHRRRRLAFAGRMWAGFGPRRIDGERRDNGPTARRAGGRRASRRGLDSLAHRGLNQHVDRAPAGEPHVPGLLVGYAVADHP